MSVQEQPWADGTPCWAELAVPDLELGRQFYGALLGWDFRIGPEETGFYSEGLVGGRTAAALNGYLPGGPGSPVTWLTYLATSDVTAAAERAAAAGGQVVAPPMDVMDFGRMAVVVDPAGAPVALWQAGSSIGAEVANEPGALIWTEHLSAGRVAAQEFYAQVAGYTYTDMSAPGFDYASAELDGRTVAGFGGPEGIVGAAEPHWAVYFAVTDTDTTAAEAVRLGGSVFAEPQDSPYGRLAGITGVFGERFWLMSTDEPSSPAAG